MNQNDPYDNLTRGQISPNTPRPDSGAGYFFSSNLIKTNMHQHPSCIGIPKRTLSVSHVLIIHIILGKIKLIFEF